MYGDRVAQKGHMTVVFCCLLFMRLAVLGDKLVSSPAFALACRERLPSLAGCALLTESEQAHLLHGRSGHADHTDRF